MPSTQTTAFHHHALRGAARAAVLAAAALAAGAAVADTHSFDFEAAAAGNYTTLSLVSNGLTMTITRFSGWTFDIFNAPGNFPASWGAHALSPFNQVAGGAFMLQFSRPITGIAVDAGDFGQDADNLSLIAGSGTASGSLLVSQALPLASVHLSLTGIETTQAVLTGGSGSFPQSVYWDNIVVTTAPVPEPGTWALAAGGLAALVFLAKRRRTTQG